MTSPFAGLGNIPAAMLDTDAVVLERWSVSAHLSYASEAIATAVVRDIDSDPNGHPTVLTLAVALQPLRISSCTALAGNVALQIKPALVPGMVRDLVLTKVADLFPAWTHCWLD